MRSALAIIAVSVSLSAQTAPPKYVEAVRLHQSGQLEAAVEAYRVYLAGDQGRPEALTNLGAALAALGRYDEALAAYDDALKRVPGHEGILRNRALALYKSGRVAAAANEFDQLRANHPKDASLAVLAADCRAQLGQDKGVIEILEPIARENAEDLAVAYLLGSALIREDRVSEGQALVEKILGRGDSAEAHAILGLTYVQAGEFSKAKSSFEAALALKPTFPRAHALLGKTLLELNERDAAAAAFRRELDLNPIDYDANFFLAVRFREDGRPAQALELLEVARRLRPQALEADYQIALCQMALGEQESARLTLEKILDAAPEFVEARVSLATVYLRLDRKQDAERQLELIRDAGR
jgi:tetratricopeptide (TPR) repeat protein